MEVEVPERVELQKELGDSQEHRRSRTRVSAGAGRVHVLGTDLTNSQ